MKEIVLEAPEQEIISVDQINENIDGNRIYAAKSACDIFWLCRNDYNKGNFRWRVVNDHLTNGNNWDRSTKTIKLAVKAQLDDGHRVFVFEDYNEFGDWLSDQ